MHKKGPKVCYISSNRCLLQPSLDLFYTQDNLNVKPDWAPFPKKKKVSGAGAQNEVDLLKQHIQFTVHYVWFLSNSTTLVLTWPDQSITETTLAL